ncbi:MAG TPA: allantoate amidohydrolase [Bryobacteraceae bacterium]|jgi:allantoate deiminase|nr:allantoate amidohydrolase [Bryobacteraceae bacterium]
MTGLANKVISRCRQIAECSEEPGRITRTFLSPPMRDVHRLLTQWMEECGMRVRVDDAGNLLGFHGRAAKRLVVGSHLDTVPNAGAFDGVLGVVLGLALVEALDKRFPGVSIEVVGFSEEEGVRFGVPFIGSRALAGTLTDDILDRGVGDAIRAFGLHPEDIPAARLSPEAVAYIEFHIEQGPVLESLDFPLGVVDAIAGQSRLIFTFTGTANHAGTTPMLLRHDALTAAAEWICRVEAYATNVRGLVATAGRIEVSPNATNVIPGRAQVSLDVRHASDEIRHAAVTALKKSAVEIGARRGIAVEHEQRMGQQAVAMDSTMSGILARSVEAAGHPVHRMISGAGHDAMILAPCVPAAMLFLRSPGGISHHPDESVLTPDVAAALEAGVRFVEQLETTLG